MIEGLDLVSGSVILVPMVNILGFERHERYLPDNRDLNRSFPGSARGSLASRTAHAFMTEVIRNCDYGIDIHTAAIGRTNYPHLRADMTVRPVRRIARAFGCEVIFDAPGSKGMLRLTATEAGCSTIVLEAGEAMKVEPAIVALGTRGVRNVLVKLGMLEGEVEPPAYRTTACKSSWVRAHRGGLVRFHVAPGAVVDEGTPVATIDNLSTHRSSTVVSPFGGIVLGMATMPAVKSGEPICHIAVPGRSCEAIRRDIEESPDSLHRRVQRDQATGFHVVEPPTRMPRE